jgi:ribosomal protein S18 acetylase RimI-like enzyme
MVGDDADLAASALTPLRLGTPADADAAARLHASEIDEGFLAQLGSAFLTRLYRRVALSPDSFLLVAEANGTMVGFLAGSLDVAALYRRFVWHDGVPAAASSLRALVRAWPLALETLRYGQRVNTAPGPGPDAPAGGDSELLAMAVHPAWQGHGIGRRLVEGFLAEVARRGAVSARVVVGAANHRAVDLYRRAGFDALEEFELHRGTRSLRLRRSFAGAGSGEPGAAS